jgi:hypothetical protein
LAVPAAPPDKEHNVTASFLCESCRGIEFPPGHRSEPDHCYGHGDRPALPGVLGGYRCSCECRNWQSPYALWSRALREHPTDEDARRKRYHDLMVEHGHIVKAEPGTDRNLPCGWPGAASVLSSVAADTTP